MRAREKEARYGGRGGDFNRRDRSRRYYHLFTLLKKNLLIIFLILAVIVVNEVLHQLTEIDVEVVVALVRHIHAHQSHDGK